MKPMFEITGDKDLLKALQSNDKNAFLNYALRKAYNIDIKDKAAPASGLPPRFQRILEERSKHHHKKRRSLYASVVYPKNVWLPDATLVRLVKDPDIEKTAYMTNSSGKLSLLARIKNIPSRFLPKKKKASKKGPVNHYGVVHSPLWYVQNFKRK